MIPVSYAYRNLLVRRRTTLMTAIGFTLVVAALIVMLAFFNGIQAACVVTGQPENIFVLNKGNLDEVLSQIDVITARQAENIPETLRDGEGRLLASRELYCVVTESDAETNEPILYQIRGVQRTAWQVHSRARISEGRLFNPSASELVVGKGFQWENRLKLGDVLEIGGRRWTIVGVFEADGSTFETEIWGDLNELAGFFRRQAVYSSIVLKTAGPAAAAAGVKRLNDSRTISVDAQLETDYYNRQAAQLETIRTGALVVVVFMAVGAVFGVTNTMFAAISQRIKDIAVMRLMGFEQREILLSFLFETLLIAVIGGLIGGALGCSIDGVSLSTSMGAKSVAFSFRVDTPTLLLAGGLTLAMGFFGGLVPAFSAMRVSPLESLR
jgi:ABC-type antimicrobial peptide transport system permease subunit